LAWPGKLGKPVLAGNRATYADVHSGVDLVVDALRTGYEQFLIIKTPAALVGLSGGGADVSWSLPVKTKGLTARVEADGSVAFVDAKNVVAPRVAATKAWDAVMDPRSGEHTSTAAVKLSVLQQGKGKAVVMMTPDQGWLADPTRVFPITIDPTYASANVTTSFDIYVSSLSPTATYSTSTELRVGTYGSGDKYRSFLSFPLASFGGKDTVSASLSLYEFYSWSCTAKPFYSYGTVGQPPATTSRATCPARAPTSAPPPWPAETSALSRARIIARRHEYVSPSLLPTQREDLEPLQDDEPGLTVEIARTPDDIVECITTTTHDGNTDHDS
jgi:large repetitive protein